MRDQQRKCDERREGHPSSHEGTRGGLADEGAETTSGSGTADRGRGALTEGQRGEETQQSHERGGEAALLRPCLGRLENDEVRECKGVAVGRQSGVQCGGQLQGSVQRDRRCSTVRFDSTGWTVEVLQKGVALRLNPPISPRSHLHFKLRLQRLGSDYCTVQCPLSLSLLFYHRPVAITSTASHLVCPVLHSPTHRWSAAAVLSRCYVRLRGVDSVGR